MAERHPLDRLRHHVTGAIERSEASPVAEVRACPADGNLLADDGVCGFCGNTPEAYADDPPDDFEAWAGQPNGG